MSVLLAKPTGTGSTTNPSGGEIGSTSGLDYVINVKAHVTRDFTRIEETTGAEDAYPVFDNNGYTYARGIFRGAMVRSSAVGFSSLKGSAVALTFTWDGIRKTTRSVMMEDIQINWKHDGVYVGVAMSYVMTGTATSTVESAV